MNCPKCRTPMVSAVRIYDGKTVKSETLYCPKCGCRRERHHSGRAALAALIALGLLAGPCMPDRNYGFIVISDCSPVIEKPVNPTM